MRLSKPQINVDCYLGEEEEGRGDELAGEEKEESTAKAQIILRFIRIQTKSFFPSLGRVLSAINLLLRGIYIPLYNRVEIAPDFLRFSLPHPC